MAYDSATVEYFCFAKARVQFLSGEDTPRAFLERGISSIEKREREVRAFVSLDLEAARVAADAATERWRAGRPLSLVDGLPFAVKDCYDVAGFPTRVNSALFDDAPPARADAAHVDALRRGGALFVGKTVTTELTMAAPGPTWNPWDLSRTPGGSSSGSAAAVAAHMVPLATGSQVRGSGLRPASICGIPALKPTFGALSRVGGFDPSPSLNHLVLLAGTLADIWDSANQIARVVGGDPGEAPWAPDDTLPAPRRPLRLARQYTVGWDKTDADSKAVFEGFLAKLAATGVEIVEPKDGPLFARYEDLTSRVLEFFFDLLLWEIRSPLIALAAAQPEAFSETMHRHIANAAKLTLADYVRALARRDELRAAHAALEGEVDGFITLAHIGPGQLGQPPLGTPWYNDASSAVGAPTINLPVLAVEGLPLGVQLMGFPGADAALMGQARWVLERFAPGTVGILSDNLV